MKTKTTNNHALFGLIGFLCFMWGVAAGAEEAFRGLWVGQVTLTHVNEVTVPLDADNHAVAPDPDVPTLTADAAHLRLILHVDGAGQVNLLKDVAILKRNEEVDAESLVNYESDLALVSDERLYSDFPVQEASRIASAVFDFGDFKATEAIDAVVGAIASNVAASVDGSGIDASSSTADLREAEDTAQGAAELGAQAIVDHADAAAAFDNFMGASLTLPKLETIAAAADPVAEASDIRLEAEALADTFYADTRAVDAIDAVVAAVEGETNDLEKLSAACFVASRYADTANLYHRFITGRDFANMIPAAAQAAAAEAGVSNATPASISTAVHALTAVSSVETAALSAQISRYSDTAASDAVESVLDAVIETATAFTNSAALDVSIATAAETAGLTALASAPRFTLPVLIPTADYTGFVQSDEFLDCVSGAAEAAAVAAVSEKKSDAFSTEDSLEGVARIAATEALRSVYILAAKARRTELPMAGTFGTGIGDPRLTVDAGANSLAAALECEINLPASHPTNPFRHPKHPDHTAGFDITRRIRLDFDGTPGDAPGVSAVGTERVTGIYREEVFGLHKPLGSGSDTGLKVEGTFELNRVSLIDTLNAQ